ncbi:MAG: DNA translocase FtsK [Ruminococcus sp.]|nr:DNA translocase FtsK [Ruminococcus sp.]
MAEKKKKKKEAAAPKKRGAAAQEEEVIVKEVVFRGYEGEDANRVWSVILFSLGVLTALMALIPGSAGWNAVHKFLLGCFGIAVFFVPVILIYTSILIGLEKSPDNVSGRTFAGVALMFLFSAAVQVFGVGYLPGTKLHHIAALFKDGMKLEGGGVVSIVIGGPLLSVFGGIGAKIITVLLFFVFILLLTGQGIIQFFETLTRPFKFLGRCLMGFHSLIMGGEFEDGFSEDDELDEDHEEEDDLEADKEALAIANSTPPSRRRSSSAAKRGLADENGFVMDVPLPGEPSETFDTDEIPVIISGTPEPVSDPGDGSEIDIALEELITKAAGSDTPGADDDLPPWETAPEQEEDTVTVPEKKEPEYILPSLDLLALPDNRHNSAVAAAEMREKADAIQNTLRSFGVEVSIKNIYRGPSITRYEVQPGVGIKVSKIKSLEDDIALSLAADGVRISPVPGKPVVGIEVPNDHKDMVTLREILESREFTDSKSKLAFAVGKDIVGNAVVGDITKMPHVIIAGTTGSGKSVCTRSIIMSILYNAKPSEVKLILIDPKIVEFKVFQGIPHLLIPIVTEAKKAAGALNWAVNEMMRRYQTFADMGANDLKSYNELIADDSEEKPLPQIVIFIDELADLMLVAGKEVEDFICRLAQMGRAAGMHLVVATQRPTTDVITGLIKANIPSRIALAVKSQVDSRTIIDMAGADRLLGNGDMLYMPITINKPLRIQGCFASPKDINATLSFIKEQGQEEYDPDAIDSVEAYTPQTKGDDELPDTGAAIGTDEDFVERAMEVAVNAGQLSTSMLQRKLKLGYARAARIMDELEELGVIGPSEGAKPRKVLMSKMQYDDRKMRRAMESD